MCNYVVYREIGKSFGNVLDAVQFHATFLSHKVWRKAPTVLPARSFPLILMADIGFYGLVKRSSFVSVSFSEFACWRMLWTVWRGALVRLFRFVLTNEKGGQKKKASWNNKHIDDFYRLGGPRWLFEQDLSIFANGGRILLGDLPYDNTRSACIL